MVNDVALSLEARNVSFSYPKGDLILDKIDCSFAKGEIVSITGRSGRGKSTLLYMLGLLHKPNAGEILIQGVRSSKMSDSRRAALRSQHFGFIFQDAALDPTRTVMENIVEASIYRMSSRSEAIKQGLVLLREMEVVHRANNRPGQVSGGQAQRIALCRALLFSPAIIIADEPTGNLDADTSYLVMNRLKAAARDGATVVIATHDTSVISASDRRIEL